MGGLAAAQVGVVFRPITENFVTQVTEAVKLVRSREVSA
jgi:phage tail sheath protein FI